MIGALALLRRAAACTATARKQGSLTPRTAHRYLGPPAPHLKTIWIEQNFARSVTSSASLSASSSAFNPNRRSYLDLNLEPKPEPQLTMDSLESRRWWKRAEEGSLIYLDAGGTSSILQLLFRLRALHQRGLPEKGVWIKETAHKDDAPVMEVFVQERDVWLAYCVVKANQSGLAGEWKKLEDSPITVSDDKCAEKSSLDQNVQWDSSV